MVPNKDLIIALVKELHGAIFLFFFCIVNHHLLSIVLSACSLSPFSFKHTHTHTHTCICTTFLFQGSEPTHEINAQRQPYDKGIKGNYSSSSGSYIVYSLLSMSGVNKS